MVRVDIDRKTVGYSVWVIDMRHATVLVRHRHVPFKFLATFLAKAYQRRYGGTIWRNDYRGKL